jgi:hypothetical protein
MNVSSFRPRHFRLPVLALVLTALGAGTAAADQPTAEQAEFFEKEVRPLLAERCFDCHGGKKVRGGLKLTSRAAILRGGDTRPAAVPGKPDESLLIQAVRQAGDLKMPPKTRLSDQEIARLTRWVQMGLPWPETPATVTAAPPGADDPFTKAQHGFWSFQPVKVTPPPAVKDRAWARSEIDRYILAALEARGLHPAPAADKRTLLRRATFDLTGLPPTPEEIDAFLADESSDAFARVVDRLLASPAYGERWGRHWLDVVRYTDSFDARILSGAGNVMDIPEAYRYRDWVVDAFNRDVPYDQFVINQIAGDLLPPRPGEANVPGIVATGMLAIGNWGGGDADKEKLLTDIADDQVDVVCRGFLGLTMACARCHDHKFDPLLTDDYYGLAGIFFSSHILADPGPKTDGPPMLRIPLLPPAEVAKREERVKRVAELEKQVKQLRDEQQGAAARALLGDTARYITAAWDYQHRGQEQAALTLGQFAAERRLNEAALRQWVSYLGLGDYRLLDRPMSKVAGQAGLFGWKGEADNPSAVVNTTDHEVAFLTIRMPPRSVAVHPSPTGGVAVAWRSPVTGTVRVSGRVADADPNCGDGIEWVLQQRQPDGVRSLASGAIPNGGAQSLIAGKGGDGLTAVDVQAGDTLLLVILPKENYYCDTTVVELEVAERDGARRTWNLVQDVVPDPLEGGKGNPHGDRQGHAEVWHVFDMAGNSLPAAAAPPGSALAAWRKTVAEAGRGQAGHAEIEKAAEAVQQALQAADAGKGPDARLYQDLTSERSPFRPAAQDEQTFPAEARDRLARLSAELAELKKQVAAPVPFAHGVQEGGCPKSPQAGVHDVRIHLRGRYDRLGKLVPRHFPRILAGENQPPITEGSGRLQLARWIASPDNPLTARVIVNRVWLYHFGEGLVRTPGNFGKLGEPPTNPQLLDYLADLLVNSGWSLKELHRAIMLSAVYQQSSVAPEETLKADPDNRLLGRMNRQRLEAEAIRDSLLAVSGRLDRTLGGRATRDFNTTRRTLYFMTVRSDRTSFRELFDAADPTAIIDKRTVSTVAPQALFLLNHPFALDHAKALAQRVLREGPADDTGKVGRLYVLLFGRPPSEPETRIGLAALRRAVRATGMEKAWEEYCQVLLCANEFIYID